MGELRKIVKVLGEQCDGTVTLSFVSLSCGHEMYTRKYVPGVDKDWAYCRKCGPGYPQAPEPLDGWPVVEPNP